MDKGTAQLPPTPQQMRARRRAGFVQMLCQADGVRVKIEGVKILDRRPPVQMFGDDVGRKDGIHLPSRWPRIISAFVIGSQRMRQVVLGQYALNRRLARRVFDAEPFQFALNRPRADQAVARLGCRTCFQHSPDGDNCLFDFFGCFV